MVLRVFLRLRHKVWTALKVFWIWMVSAVRISGYGLPGGESQSSPEPSAQGETEQKRSGAAEPLRSQMPELSQVGAVNPEAGDTVDAADASDFKTESTNMPQALLKVLECIYQELFPTEHNASQSYKLQPLYQLLVEEVTATINTVGQKTAHVRSSRLVAIVLCVLTHHLQQRKQNAGRAREKTFRTPERKVEFIRRYTRLCMETWLPPSLLESKLLNLFLNEYLSLNVLKPGLSKLSEPDFINQIVVKMRDPKTLEGEAVPVQEERREAMQPTCTSENEDTDLRSINEDDAVVKPKKKGFWQKRKIKTPFQRKKNGSDRQHSRRQLEATSETNIYFRTLASEEENETWEAESCGKQRRKSEGLMETEECWAKLFCTFWKTDCMTVKVVALEFHEDPDEGESISCTIRIEEKDDPDNEFWKVEKTLNDILFIQDKLGRDFPALKIAKIPLSSISKELNILADDACIQRAKKILNTFLQALLTLIQTSENIDACHFLLPLEGQEEDWNGFRDVLEELLSLLSDDDLNLIQRKTGLAKAVIANGSEHCSEMEDHHQHTNSSEKYEFHAELATACIETGYAKSHVSKQLCLQSPVSSHSPAHRCPTRQNKDEELKFRGLTCNDEKSPPCQIAGTRKKRVILGTSKHEPDQEKEEEDVKMVLNKLKDCPEPLTEALQRLLKEICIESFRTELLTMVLKIARRKAEKYLEEICESYLSESKLSSYVDKLRESLWSKGRRPAAPVLERTSDMMLRTKAKLEAQLSQITFYESWKVTSPLIASVVKHIKLKPHLHNIFQDAEDNERLIYMCLFYLSEELIPGLGQSLDVPWLKIKDE